MLLLVVVFGIGYMSQIASLILILCRAFLQLLRLLLLLYPPDHDALATGGLIADSGSGQALVVMTRASLLFLRCFRHRVFHCGVAGRTHGVMYMSGMHNLSLHGCHP